jgi:hypothetical protein
MTKVQHNCQNQFDILVDGRFVASCWRLGAGRWLAGARQHKTRRAAVEFAVKKFTPKEKTNG